MYLNEWAKDGHFGMVMDFADVYLTKQEYENPDPYRVACNPKYWAEMRAKVEAALADPRYQVEVLLASYAQGGYEGDAFVLFRKDGQLFEVNAGHCSCHNLEGQWEPESTTVEALRHRLEQGSLGREGRINVFADELKQVLDGLQA